MAADPYYQCCARNELLHDHICQADPLRPGKMIEWEHAIKFKGSELQRKWAIIPTCYWAHRGPGLDKNINIWIALNRATDEELREISTAENMIEKRNRLNALYGVPTDEFEEINLDILLVNEY